MIPTPGRSVHYTLNAEDARQVNRRRSDASENMHVHLDNHDGSQVHVGNPVEQGQAFPMTIVRVWGKTEASAVNGQVHLDGNDTLWVTSRQQGNHEGQWYDPRTMEEPARNVIRVRVPDDMTDAALDALRDATGGAPWERVPNHGTYLSHEAGAFSVEPDGCLQLRRTSDSPAYFVYQPGGWLWVGTAGGHSAFAHRD